MEKNICQAKTKKNKPCKNSAIEGSDFCHVHAKPHMDFPPIKITAYICPYCEKPIRKNAESCGVCEETFKICPYCDEPLRQDAKLCNFCQLFRPPIQPIRNDVENFTSIQQSSSADGASLSFGILFVVPVFLFVVFLFVVLTYMFSY